MEFHVPGFAGWRYADEVFSADKTLHLNGATIALELLRPAHTDSDISVHFTEADIIDVADTLWNGHFPFIDYSTGGSIDGMIRAAEANVASYGQDHCDSGARPSRRQVSTDRIPRHAWFRFAIT